MSKLKAGIIGLGVGEQHIAGFEAHRDCRVAALCDFDPAKETMAREKYPDKRFYRNDLDLLEDPELDLVSIASFDDHHHAQIIRALKNKKHVFVEKPVCQFEYQLREIRSALEANPGLMISSNLILRQSPRFLSLKAKVERGELGRVYYMEGDYNYGRLKKITSGWRGKLDFYSVILGGDIHMVDLLMWITGDRPVEVSAMGNNLMSQGTGFKFNDMVACLLRFESGALAKISANFGCVMPHFHGLMLYGDKATFINGMPGAKLYVSRDPEVSPIAMNEPYPGVHKGALIKSFVQAVLGQGEPLVASEDVFAGMSVCLAMEKAVNQPGPVPVEYI